MVDHTFLIIPVAVSIHFFLLVSDEHQILCNCNCFKNVAVYVFVCVFQMCERCNRHTECTKRLSIQRFPQVIVIRILGNNSHLSVLTLLASWCFCARSYDA